MDKRFDTVIDRRNTNSLKHDFAVENGLPADVMPMWVADMDFKGLFNDKLMYVFIALRHIALPLAMIVIIKLVCLIGINVNPVVTMVIAILAAAPAATSATMFAESTTVTRFT